MRLYGISEIAEVLGVSRQAAANYLSRGSMPEPDARLAMGPVWTAETIEPWLRERGILAGVDAVLVHNNAYDAILVSNGAALTVDPDTFRDFVRAATDDPHWYDWGSPDMWDEHGETLDEVAPKYGEIVAYYVGQQLTVVDRRLWDERREFYLRDTEPKE